LDADLLSALEERLRQAMLAGDADSLDRLIADGLVFTTQTGEVMGKAADLAAHRSGLLRLTRLDPSDRRTVTQPESAVVSVQMDVAGTYGGELFFGLFRYTRVWALMDGRWQVVAGHVSAVAPPTGADL
jgi:hypothetical protein